MNVKVAILWLAALGVALVTHTLPVAADSKVYSLDDQGGLSSPVLPAKTVLLTFDDGPSQYTPQILQVLKDKNVHGTFFVVGKETAHRKELAAIYDAGHDIGNHSYGHPNLSLLSPWRVNLELTLNRLAIESQTGHGTRLLRLPYYESDSLTAQSTELIKTAARQGYVTVGENVNAEDWQRPGVDAIIKNAVTPEGGIILMHDGGGNQEQTVRALPAIIDAYQKQGYQFMTVSQALGLSRDDVMPPQGAIDGVLAGAVTAVFGLNAFSQSVFFYVIILLVVASFGRMFIILVVANIQARRKLPPLADGTISCSVLMPAYNEAAVIQSCLKSVLASDYRNFEVLVVDDGSKDNTAELAEAVGDARVRVLRKVNGGKASALNYGIEQARGKIVIAIDADTVFQKNTLRQLVRHFDDPSVGAVSGNTRIVNRHKLITKLQSLEYIVGFNLDRRMGDFFDCITVVPGAIGAFRKSALLCVGGFTYDTLAEDTDLTLAIKEARYKIVYDAEAIAYTEAPSTVRDLLKQRFRWTFGTMQAVWKHRKAMLNPRYGTLGMIGLPYLVLFQIVFPLLGPFFDLSVLVGLIGHHYSGIAISVIVYTLADIIMSAVAIRLDGDSLKQLWLLVPQRIFYRQLMYYVIFKSFINVLRGNLVGWGALKREGTHLAEASE